MQFVCRKYGSNILESSLYFMNQVTMHVATCYFAIERSLSFQKDVYAQADVGRSQ